VIILYVYDQIIKHSSIMFAEERHKKLLSILEIKGEITVPEIEAELNVSPATIRRDLILLERLGKIIRTHGGAMHPSVSEGEITYQQRAMVNMIAKEKIAQVAASYVKPGSTIYLDAGTTCQVLAKLLRDHKGLTLFTNSLPILSLARNNGAKICVPGGELRIPSLSLVGSISLKWLENIRFDIAFMGASGLHPSEGASVPSFEEAAMKQAAMQRAGSSILLADFSKWNVPQAVLFGKWHQFNTYITDKEPDNNDIIAINDYGCQIVA
jgi:DeoR family transcriptional regulator, fructose operon transcriptional repressor